MNLVSKRAVPYALAIVLASLICIPLAQGQALPADQKAENVFKNIQILKGISVKEFMDTMGFFSAATGLNCIDCHSPDAADSLAAYATDTPLKQTARKMLIMVQTIDKSNFGGQLKVTCYTCHKATDHPEAIPSLLDQYSVAPDDPDRVEVIKGGAAPPNQPTADQIIDKYIQAIGGAAQVAKLTSYVGKGTYEGFDTYSEKVPYEFYAKAPNQLTTIIHTQHGDSVATYDGTHAWTAASDKLMRVLPLAGGDLAGAKMDGVLSFPAQIKQGFKWRTGFPSVSIDDKPVDVIQDAAGGDTGAKLYFDKQSGLLLRQVRYSDTAVGVIPAQVDYSDYRLVAGVKVPFHVVWTWTDGRSIIQLNEIQPNVQIAAAKFAMPATPVAKPEAK